MLAARCAGPRGRHWPALASGSRPQTGLAGRPGPAGRGRRESPDRAAARRSAGPCQALPAGPLPGWVAPLAASTRSAAGPRPVPGGAGRAAGRQLPARARDVSRHEASRRSAGGQAAAWLRLAAVSAVTVSVSGIGVPAVGVPAARVLAAGGPGLAVSGPGALVLATGPAVRVLAPGQGLAAARLSTAGLSRPGQSRAARRTLLPARRSMPVGITRVTHAASVSLSGRAFGWSSHFAAGLASWPDRGH